MALRTGSRAGIAATLAAAALGAAAPSALGVARVGDTAGALVVAVDAGADQNTAHGLIVEPFVFSVPSRDGWRVRQDQFGRPTITSSDPDCLTNPVANDVVCGVGGQTSLQLTTGGGADVVTLIGFNAAAQVCFRQSGVTDRVAPATVDLGAGDDRLVVQDACPPGDGERRNVAWSVTADGGPGLDILSGGEERDTLLGGDDADDLNGAGADDLLRGQGGRDVLDGGSGGDTLRGGDGLDKLNGGDGDDLLHAGLDGGGPDTFVGGPGIDTVTYSFASSPVSVTIFNPVDPNANASDGRAGENDYLQNDVENVIGGAGDDSLTGNNLANRIEGAGGRDTIIGATGADALLGGEADDTLNAVNGIRDPVIDCGPGAADVAVIDLADLQTRITGCETQRFFATDDGPPGEIRAGVLRVGAGRRASVQLKCPRAARVDCAGRLSVSRASGGPVVARARYRVARGTSEAVVIRVPAGLRGARAVLVTSERGVSRKGPRGVRRVVTVR